MEEESICKSLIIILRKKISLIKLLLLTHLNKIKKLKKSNILLWILFGLFLLIKNFLSHYKQKLQKQ